MDAMYRKKNREAEKALSAEKKQKGEKHVADDYSPKIRPRETHPDAIDSEKRISKNLNKLNRQLVETPAGAVIKGKTKEGVAVAANEDRGAKVITRAVAAKAQAPLAIIFSCVLVAVVFMYMLSLSVQIEEYSQSISQMENQITSLKATANQLEVQLEGKYDLGEVERIATQEYGMVAASSLPKKYISVSGETEVWQKSEKQEDSLTEAISRLFATVMGE